MVEAKPKTVPVPDEVLKGFKKHASTFLTKKECIAYYDLSYTVLKNVLRFGTCAPETLDKIEAGLLKQKEA